MNHNHSARVPRRCQRLIRREGRELLFFPFFVLILAVILVGVLQYIYSYTVRDHIFFILLPCLGFVAVCRFGYVGTMGYFSPHRTTCGKGILQQAAEQNPLALDALMQQINEDLALHGKKTGRLLVGQTWLRCGRLFIKQNNLRAFYCRQEQDWRKRTVVCLQDKHGQGYRVPGGKKAQAAALWALRQGVIPGLAEIEPPPCVCTAGQDAPSANC